MTIKKLTVAAAIAVGIATCSINSVMAACPCETGGACPLSGCQKMVAPMAACPICGQNQATCGCKPAPCAAPCVAIPIATPCAVPCCPVPCKTSVPACATCPTSSCHDLDMKQVYAYPNAIYGDNNYVGQESNGIYSTETAFNLDTCDEIALARNGIIASSGQMMGAASPCGCGCGTGYAAPFAYAGALTGMAAPCGHGCGCGCDCGCSDGVGVAGPCKRGSYHPAPIITGCAAPCGCLPVITGGAAPICGDGCGCATTIQTCDSVAALKKCIVPFQVTQPTGCAAPCDPTPPPPACDCTPLTSAFPDVPNSYWAACPIDKLATNCVVVGYPDRLFRPGRNISRAEFATMMVKGYNLNCDGLCSKGLFSDVPRSHWANPLIAKAVEEGIMCGYPNKKFMPKKPVSRVEALTAMAHGINCDISCDKAQEILSQYCDGGSVPSWAQIPVAKALNAGVLKNSLSPNTINPCNEASRAEIADMLQNTRIAVGFDTNPKTACDCPPPVACPVAACPAAPCSPCTAYMEQDTMVQIPTLKLKFQDEINAKSSHVGQRFAAKTTEAVTINGCCYECGTRVNGKIVEVIRPSGCDKGALKVAFTEIVGCNGCKVDLPKQILSAQVSCERNQNIIARLAAAPFTLVGGLVGTTARTVGGIISNAGNAFEDVSGGVGIASSEIFQGQFLAAGRSVGDAVVSTVMAPIDLTRTAISGAAGLFQTAGDEVAYLVDPSGAKIAAINPKEKVTIAFGCR